MKKSIISLALAMGVIYGALFAGAYGKDLNKEVVSEVVIKNETDIDWVITMDYRASVAVRSLLEWQHYGQAIEVEAGAEELLKPPGILEGNADYVFDGMRIVLFDREGVWANGMTISSVKKKSFWKRSFRDIKVQLRVGHEYRHGESRLVVTLRPVEDPNDQRKKSGWERWKRHNEK